MAIVKVSAATNIWLSIVVSEKSCRRPYIVMAGLVPAIHVFLSRAKHQDIDGRHKAGHDAVFESPIRFSLALRPTV
jgi:hypothetical protein